MNKIRKIKIYINKDKKGYKYFYILIHNVKYKQYILENNIIYTFFIIMQFLYKYGFVKIKNVCI